MSSEAHVFLCCDRGDHVAWLEASWLADQDVEIWCEDGVNPGNPDWSDCEQAMASARERLFLVTNQFIHSIDSLAKLTHSLKHDLPCTAVVLEPLAEGSESERLLQQCQIVRKYELSLPAYRSALGEYLGVEPNGAPQVAGSLSPIQESGYRLGEWRVYPQMLRIESDNESKTLDRRLFDVLGALVSAAPDPVTIDQFLEQVWGQTVVEDNSVHRAISRLRKAFRDNPKAPTYIETISKTGYRLVCPVVTAEARSPTQSVHTRNVYIQLKAFEGIGGDDSAILAQSLTTQIQATLAGLGEFHVMPRADQIPEVARKARFFIVGLVHRFGDGVRVSLEIHDLSKDRLVWTQSRDIRCPETFAEQTALAAQLTNEIALGIRQSYSA